MAEIKRSSVCPMLHRLLAIFDGKLQPLPGGAGVRDATKFSNHCEQWHIWDDYFFTDPGPSEDCIYLNVYARPRQQSGAATCRPSWFIPGSTVAVSLPEQLLNRATPILRLWRKA